MLCPLARRGRVLILQSSRREVGADAGVAGGDFNLRASGQVHVTMRIRIGEVLGGVTASGARVLNRMEVALNLT